MITSENISLYYNNTEILSDLSLHINAHESLAIIGPSGCGKTSLLHIFAGLIKPTSGSIFVNHTPLLKPRRTTALISQHYSLLPWKTVFENICLPLHIQKVKRSAFDARTKATLTMLGLNHVKSKYPTELSGGEQQRVAIARALVQTPDLLLFDEAFSSLDAITRDRLQSELKHLHQSTKTTMIFVTHDIEEALYLGERILVMSTQPGTVFKTFVNPSYHNPDAKMSQGFHQLSNQLRQTLNEVMHDAN
ncbi:NitT/TauT family transport system ATP-binding protein [Streptohalobacillus salinus]|uniref:NitT/TauT family transport system ATP-binding protein n=1 Tax=Streptohalobacillus salinus TaxID=621096 RepID=A0A2V3WD58_9BACI|nr:ABC transporter ATP-binding protein [Streptohalobacillus salinus]PXW92690.1 NitT/TauT family transport system ATP-binding protein [Streptohalobacillus salinus]